MTASPRHPALAQLRRRVLQEADAAAALACLRTAFGDERWLSVEAQEALLEPLQAQPEHLRPSPKFQHRLLQPYLTTLEAHPERVEDLSDELFAHFAALQASSHSSVGHMTFEVPIVVPARGEATQCGEGAAVTGASLPAGKVQRAPEPTGAALPRQTAITVRGEAMHNEVGLRMWEAGFRLAELLLTAPNLVHGRRVLELGAGLGLTGIVAAKCCGARDVVLTDCAAHVLQNLERNVELNAQTGLRVEALDWTEDDAHVRHTNAEVILAADVLYDPTIVPGLVRTLRSLLSADNGRSPGTVDVGKAESPATATVAVDAGTARDPAIGDTRVNRRTRFALIAATLRNPATLELFLEHCRQAGLQLDTVSFPPSCPEDSLPWNNCWAPGLGPNDQAALSAAAPWSPQIGDHDEVSSIRRCETIQREKHVDKEPSCHGRNGVMDESGCCRVCSGSWNPTQSPFCYEAAGEVYIYRITESRRTQ